MAEVTANEGQVVVDGNSNSVNKGRQPIQQPGQVITPDVPDGIVEKIAEEMYGLHVTQCQPLNSYFDKNYHIRVSPTSSNPHVTSVCPEGYVLKVVNTINTANPDTFDAQAKMMSHFRSHGITTQETVPSVHGNSIVFYQFPSSTGEGQVKTHAVCVRTFIPGTVLCQVSVTPDLCFKVGVLLANISKALQDFYHPFYEMFDSIWTIDNMPKMKDFLYAIDDVKDRQFLHDVIEEFETKVMPRRGELRKGYIHGDPNEQNILVKRVTGDGSDAQDHNYVIAGILDFDLAADSYPLYDLAIAITYVMTAPLTFDPLEVAGHVMAGYCSVTSLPEVERSFLKAIVCGRLAQSLVMGAYTYKLQPYNTYVLATATRGWSALKALWAAADVERLWQDILRSYQQ